MAKTTTKAAPKAKAAKAKAKEKEEVKEEKAVDYSKYDYRPSDNLTVKAQYIGQIRQALQIAVQGGTKEHYPTALAYIAVNSGVEVDNPSKEAIQKGQVRPILSLEKTFEQANLKATYEPWVAAIAQALEVINTLHVENVDAGNATLRSDLEAEAKAAQAKAEEAKAAQAKAEEATAEVSDPDA